jgi:hypothetical protein
VAPVTPARFERHAGALLSFVQRPRGWSMTVVRGDRTGAVRSTPLEQVLRPGANAHL